ncbi:MAG TPA: selenide, water dikinase SelD [Clostridia bacterium]|nr:selenide, water dikinase SelD [Clostridia bacterium]
MPKIDIAKRRQVMERSMRLGHCICEPRRPCPCDVFREQGICPCAGERPDPIDLSQLKLTSLVRNPGCASKISPGDLEGLLGRLPPVNDPAVISGLAAADDAAIYRMAEDLCLVQTVDVFTPCVDDPRLFGRICAANCLSDIYAMGGDPRTALSILAFPSETLSGEVMFQMLSGAMETLAEAGVALIGGHSIKDEEIKLGFAITGLINPKTAAALDAPQVGDKLVLTKPLGTGVLAFAQQVGKSCPAGMNAATTSMATLNKAAAEAMREAGASACTDITGFGLFGHLMRMLRQRQLTAKVDADALPAFEGVLNLFRNDVIPGAVERNREFVGEELGIEPGVDEAFINLGFDAQTSGGLLIAIAPERLQLLQQNLLKQGISGYVIGSIVEHTGKSIVVGPSSTSPTANKQPQVENAQTVQTMNPPSSPETHSPDCCADIFGKAAVGNSSEAQRAFGAFMRAVQAGGALDEKTKELILFSLVLQSRCEPCFGAHYQKACEMGITAAELEEAAWCAIAMGGAPVRMFYQECLRAAQAKA